MSSQVELGIATAGASTQTLVKKVLAREAIQIDAKPRGLNVTEFVVRQVAKDGEEDTGWRFQAVIQNNASTSLTDLEYALRYYDSGGRFIGLDEGFALGSDDLGRHEDKSISISLNVPASASKAVFSLKARRINFLEKHDFLIVGAAIVLAAILFFLSEIF